MVALRKIQDPLSNHPVRKVSGNMQPPRLSGASHENLQKLHSQEISSSGNWRKVQIPRSVGDPLYISRDCYFTETRLQRMSLGRYQ